VRVSQKTGEPGYRQKNTVEQEIYEEARSASYGEQRNRNGEKRKLGIPTVIDRMIQQAIKYYNQFLNLNSSIIALGFVQIVVRKWASYGHSRITNKSIK
jgi:hypothetical protein